MVEQALKSLQSLEKTSVIKGPRCTRVLEPGDQSTRLMELEGRSGEMGIELGEQLPRNLKAESMRRCSVD